MLVRVNCVCVCVFVCVCVCKTPECVCLCVCVCVCVCGVCVWCVCVRAPPERGDLAAQRVQHDARVVHVAHEVVRREDARRLAPRVGHLQHRKEVEARQRPLAVPVLVRDEARAVSRTCGEVKKTRFQWRYR